MAAFRAAHPQSKHPVGQQVERIHHPVPPDVMLESILRYYGGERLSSVCSLMGYTQPVTREALRHRVCTWRKKHPALAAGMPPKRPKTPIKEKNMELNIDAKAQSVKSGEYESSDSGAFLLSVASQRSTTELL